MNRAQLKVLTIVFLGLTAGCAAVPERQLHAYDDAYSEMHQAARRYLEPRARQEIATEARRLEQARGERAQAAQQDGPAYFEAAAPADLSKVPVTGAVPQQRPTWPEEALAGLEAGAAYNRAMLALASGKSTGEAQASFAAAAAAVAGAAAPWVGLVKEALAEVERARTREQLVDALTREWILPGTTRADHPVALMLDLLVAMLDREYLLVRNQARRAVLTLSAPAAMELSDGFTTQPRVLFLAELRDLAMKAKHHFKLLQDAARAPAAEASPAELLRNASDIIGRARVLAGLANGLRF